MYVIQDCLAGYATFESFASLRAARHALRAVQASNAGDYRLVRDDGTGWIEVIA